MRRLDLACHKIPQVLRPVGALNDVRRPVVAADAPDDVGIVRAIAFREENVRGAAEVTGRFAKGASRQHEFVSERGLPVDEHDFEPVAHADVLEAIVEDQSVRLKFLNRVGTAFDTVPVHEDDDTAEVVRQHERLVARSPRIEQQGLSIADDARDEDRLLFCELVHEAEQQRAGDALVAAAEDGDAPASFLEGSCQELDHRRLARAAHGQVPHADDEAAVGMAAKDAVSVEREPGANDAPVNEGQDPEQATEQIRAPAIPAVENDVDRKGFEPLDQSSHGRIWTPELSAPTTAATAESSPDASIMAFATFSGLLRVAHAIVEPEPLSHPPRAPALRAAWMTGERNGISGSRYGWWRRSSKHPERLWYLPEVKAAAIAAAQPAENTASRSGILAGRTSRAAGVQISNSGMRRAKRRLFLIL